MDCGIPFCHQGCPLGNLIPEWNDLTWRGEGRRDRAAARDEQLPGVHRSAVPRTVRDVVRARHQPAPGDDQAESRSRSSTRPSEGLGEPQPPERLTGKTVAVVGSGPAGLAAAQQLTRAGHTVAVFERDDRIGGLLRYGIPDFKMEKRHLERRLEQMQAEGTGSAPASRSARTLGDDLRARYDAVVVATGATVPRDLPIPGATSPACTSRWSTWPQSNQAGAGDSVADQITAEGKHVVVIGGGDTGADCIGTAHRQGASASPTSRSAPSRPDERPEHQPWPTSGCSRSSPRTRRAASARTSRRRRVPRQRVGEVRALRVAETESRRPPCRAAPSARSRRPGADRAGLHRPGAGGSSSSSASSSTTAATWRATRLRVERARRLRRRRRRPRPVAHRVGDRRGPCRGRAVDRYLEGRRSCRAADPADRRVPLSRPDPRGSPRRPRPTRAPCSGTLERSRTHR